MTLTRSHSASRAAAVPFAAGLALVACTVGSSGAEVRAAEVQAVPAHGSALADAARRGDAAAVRALLAGGEDPDAAQGDGATALHWAAYRGDAEMVAALIRAGADVQRANRYGVTPLALAALPLRAASASGVTP